ETRHAAVDPTRHRGGMEGRPQARRRETGLTRIPGSLYNASKTTSPRRKQGLLFYEKSPLLALRAGGVLHQRDARQLWPRDRNHFTSVTASGCSSVSSCPPHACGTR